ncbi:MAG: sigma factor-like helix-turn-helix DNA-binding protein, partial [Myxococcota bacterium]
ALLVCLPRGQRMAYVLGEILELTGPEAADLLGVTATAYRQRLAGARTTVRAFFRSRCGLVDSTLPCRCSRQVAGCVRVGWLDPAQPRLATVGRARELERTFDHAAAVYRSELNWEASAALIDRLETALDVS